MTLKGGEQVLIVNEAEVVAPPGFTHVIEYGQQIILATDAAIAEATRLAVELKQGHPDTIRREVDDLIGDQLYDLFARSWQPQSNHR